MWVIHIWPIADPLNKVSIDTDIKSAYQIDASLSATVVHQHHCRTQDFFPFDPDLWWHWWQRHILQTDCNFVNAWCWCCASSVHVCRPQALPWAHHHQVCRDEEAGGHIRGGAHTLMKTPTWSMLILAQMSSCLLHINTHTLNHEGKTENGQKHSPFRAFVYESVT